MPTKRFPELWDEDPDYSFVLASDLDHTMVQNEDPKHSHLLEFGSTWSSGLGLTSALIYSTGRSPELFRELWEEAPMLTPQVLICSVGTEIYVLSRKAAAAEGCSPGPPCLDLPGLQAHAQHAFTSDDGRSLRLMFRPDLTWLQHLNGEGWDREQVVAVASAVPQLILQAPSEQRAHKISFHLQQGALAPDAVVEQLSKALSDKGLPAKVIFSGGSDVDILPRRAGKGFALDFVLKSLYDRKQPQLAWPKLGVQVNGDSGNDVELFEVPRVNGCVVANAHPELRRFADVHKDDPRILHASLPCSGGIVEAMHHFGTLATSPPAAQEWGLDPVCLLSRHLGMHLAFNVIRGQGGGTGSSEVALSADELPDMLKAQLLPATSLLLRLGPGLASCSEDVPCNTGGAWVDILECTGLPAVSEGAAAPGSFWTGPEAQVFFQVYHLQPGFRDSKRFLSCLLSFSSLPEPMYTVAVS